MSFLIEDLIESVKRRGYIPISQNTETSDALTERLTDDLLLAITPMIESVKENYFLDYKRIEITAGKSRYPIPARASGGAIKDVWLCDASGNRFRTMPKVDVHNLQGYQSGGNHTVEFLVFGDELMIFPTPTQTSGYIEIWFYLRPNRLIATTSCAKITGMSTVAGVTTLTVDTDLTASLSTGDKVDFLSAKAPFLLWAYDVAITAITSTTIEVSAANISDELSVVEPIVGDYICPAGFSNIPMVPQEFHAVLAQKAAASTLLSMGDVQKSQAADALYAQMMGSCLKLIANRIEGEPEVIMNRDGAINFIGGGVVGGNYWR